MFDVHTCGNKASFSIATSDWGSLSVLLASPKPPGSCSSFSSHVLPSCGLVDWQWDVEERMFRQVIYTPICRHDSLSCELDKRKVPPVILVMCKVWRNLGQRQWLSFTWDTAVTRPFTLESSSLLWQTHWSSLHHYFLSSVGIMKKSS